MLTDKLLSILLWLSLPSMGWTALTSTRSILPLATAVELPRTLTTTFFSCPRSGNDLIKKILAGRPLLQFQLATGTSEALMSPVSRNTFLGLIS